MSELRIGTTKWSDNRNSGGNSGFKNFKLLPGSNHFRILPPLHSLADSGSYYKYWRVHWGFLTTNGKPKPIVCVERRNRDRVVYERCPICDMVENTKKEFEHIKSSGASPEEIQEFEKNRINAFEGKGNYYAYAFNANNELGLLKLTKTMRDQFEARGKEVEADGFEINGIEGIFVDIKKTGQGRFNTKYQVDVVMEADPNNRGAKRYKTHILTPELQKMIIDKTMDLSNLYKPLPVEELSLLVSEEDDQARAELLTRFTSRGDTQVGTSGYMSNTEIKSPGQHATFVSRTELKNSKLESSVPNLSKLQQEQPEVAPQTQVVSVDTSNGSSKPAEIDLDNMSDDDFMNAFNQRFKS